MNKLFKIFLFVILTLSIGMFTACDNDDDNSRNTVLEAFGPSPALRGGELTFIGKGINNVVKVILPDDIEITDIQTISKERIAITIPQNAQPGYVTLELANGKKLVTKTILSYTEPIVLSSFNPTTVKPGAELTIEGDYLNLIQRVIFAEDVVVGCEEFKTWERSKIILNVPLQAQTGIIILADSAAIPLEIKSEDVLNVVLPSVAEVQSLSGRKPGDKIVITGTNLDLVEEVVVPEDQQVEFTLSENQLSFTLPENTKDGQILLVAYSGVEVICADLEMAVPAQLEATPSIGIKAGDAIVVKGVNMELVTTILFPNVAAAVEPVSKTTTQIQVTMPDDAITGDLILNTASGKTVSVKIETLKPVIESYEPSTVSAGNDLVIKGANLDLISKITFGGDQSIEIIPSSATELTLQVPVDAESGELILTMKNGETVTAPSLTVEKPECAYIPVLPEGEISAGTVLIVDVKNGNKLTSVQLNGTDVQYILLGEQLYVSVPASLNGKTVLRLVSSNGEISYTLDIIGSNIIETVVYEGLHNLGNWVNFTLDASALQGLKTGMYMRISFITNDTNETWWQMKLMSQLDGWPALDNYPDILSLTYVAGELQTMDVTLTLNDVDNLVARGLAIGGHEVTITKITLIEERSQEVIIYEGPKDVGNWSGYAEIGADKFSTAKVGQVVKVNTSDVQVDAQGSFKTPNGWGEIASGTEWFDITGDFELPITEETLAKLQDAGLIIGGKNYIIQSVSIK